MSFIDKTVFKGGQKKKKINKTKIIMIIIKNTNDKEEEEEEEEKKKMKKGPDGIRTHDLPIQSPVSLPLDHGRRCTFGCDLCLQMLSMVKLTVHVTHDLPHGLP